MLAERLEQKWTTTGAPAPGKMEKAHSTLSQSTENAAVEPARDARSNVRRTAECGYHQTSPQW